MFNEELKQRYLKENSYRNMNLTTQMTTEFNKLEDRESSLEKDACNFTTSEIMDYYKSLFSNSVQTLIVLNTQLKLYTTWCQSNNLLTDNQNHYSEITTEMLLSCVNDAYVETSFITREDLISQFQYLPNARDQFIILALYEGLGHKKMQDFLTLSVNDFHDGIVKLRSGRELSVSSELVSLANQSQEEDRYYFFGGADKIESRAFPEGQPYVVKTYKYIERDEDHLQNIFKLVSVLLMKISDYLGENFTINNIRKSGMIHMVKQLYQNGDYSLKECIKINRKDIEYRFGRIQSVSTWISEYGKYIEA